MAVLEAVVEWLALADKEANETPYSLFYRRLSPLAMSPVLSPASMSPDNSEPSTPHEEQHGEVQLQHHHYHQQQHVESSHGDGGGGGGGEKGQPTVDFRATLPPPKRPLTPASACSAAPSALPPNS